MKAVLLLDERREIGEDRFIELVVWQVPQLYMDFMADVMNWGT